MKLFELPEMVTLSGIKINPEDIGPSMDIKQWGTNDCTSGGGSSNGCGNGSSSGNGCEAGGGEEYRDV